MLVAPQREHRALKISTDASSINLAGVADGNGIDHAAARIANEIGHFATFLDHEAAVTVRASGDFMRDDQVAAFALGHVG